MGVITGGGRREIIEAALDAPDIKCLVLTGHQRPQRDLIDRAEAEGVPMILAGQNTLPTAVLCSEMVDRVWVKPGPTLDGAVEHVRSNIDIDRILEKALDQ